MLSEGVAAGAPPLPAYGPPLNATDPDAGLTIGEWVDQGLARAAEEARNPKPPAASREDVAELLDARLKPGEEALGRLAAQLAKLEEKVSRRTGAGPARAKAQAKDQGRPRLRLPEPGAW